MNFFNFVIRKKLAFLIVSILINGLLIITCGFLLWNNLNKEPIIEQANDLIATSTEEDTASETFYVEIKGAVKKPGVYEANSNNIINDTIKLAGGLTKDAYTDNINLSKKLSNELVIYIYTKKQYEELNKKEPEVIIEKEIIYEECVCPSYEINDCTNNGSSLIVPDENEKNNNIIVDSNELANNDNKNDNNLENEKVEPKDDDIKDDSKLININVATKEELMTLSGIGESKAKSIIEYREKNKFINIEDIKNVSGIGDSAFDKIKNFITVK